MENKERLEKLDKRMYNLNANLSALVYIQKLKTLKEAEAFMGVINREIAGWIKEIRDIHEKMEELKVTVKPSQQIKWIMKRNIIKECSEV